MEGQSSEIHQRIAQALKAELKPGAVLPTRIILWNDRLGVQLTLSYHPEKQRAVVFAEIGRSRKKSFLGSVALVGITEVRVDPTEGEVKFQTEAGQVLSVDRQARFRIAN